MADKQTPRVDTDQIENELTLDFIKDLGGNKNDLALVQGVADEDQVFEVLDEDFDAEPVKRDEIRNLLNELEIYKFRPKDKSEDEKKKKKKMLTMPIKDESTPLLAQKDPQTKKSKNKFKLQHSEVSSTSQDTTIRDSLCSHFAAYKARKQLLLSPGSSWRDEQTSPLGDTGAHADLIKQMEAFAVKLMEDEVTVFTKRRDKGKKSEAMWMKTVITSGTLRDKIAALTLLVQGSPLHNLHSLQSLVAMVKKKGKRESLMAAEALKELFISLLLPDDGKLRSLSQNNLSKLQSLLGNADAVDRKILQWYFESKLRTEYDVFIQALVVLSHDTLLATKQQALKILFQLLTSKPEKEKTILEVLVNKIGDPDYKLASKASHYLTKLVQQHPNMKSVIVDEVERLLYRPNIASQAQYYSVCFLNQLILSHKERVLATRFILIYISFFKSFVKKKTVDTKIMSALLTGVNRAYPFTKGGDETILYEQLDTLYKIVHIVNFNTSLQALLLLYQVMDTSHSSCDRYYTALYKKMLDPALVNSSKQALFLNLVFKSMKKDDSEKRIKAFVKRLLQLCSQQPPHFICGTLLLLSEILKSKSGILSLNHKSEDSDEEETFFDVPDPEDTGVTAEKTEIRLPVKSSWVHRQNLGVHVTTVNYNPCHRNPKYCGADHECIWELEKLARHFHPSVSLFAITILKGKNINYTGDPLHDFTLIRFLDRFVFKNPKSSDKVQEASVTTLSRAMCRKPVKRSKQVAVNTKKFLEMPETQVTVEDKFFYKYFKQKDAKKKERDNEMSDAGDSDVSDNEFDKYLDNYEKQVDGGLDNLGDLDMDFAGVLGKKKGKVKRAVMQSDSDDDDVSDDLSDEEVDFGDDEELAAAFQSDESDTERRMDDENFSFSDEELPSDPCDPSARKSLKRKNMSDGISNKSSSLGLFAAAEEFSHLMDENVGLQSDMTSLHALSNKDSADEKQLKWEVDRDQWMKNKGKNKEKQKRVKRK